MLDVDLDAESAYPVYFAGNAASEARGRLRLLAKERELPVPIRGDPGAHAFTVNAFYDWEPLEVLCELIADNESRTVGGVPQIIKLYQNGLTEGFVWRDPAGRDHFGGRRVLDQERSDRRTVSYEAGNVTIHFSDRSIYAREVGGGDEQTGAP